jgi:hypothetical protein
MEVKMEKVEEVKEVNKKEDFTITKLSRFEIKSISDLVDAMTIDGLSPEGKRACIFTISELSAKSKETENLKVTLVEKLKTKEYTKLKEKVESKTATKEEEDSVKEIESKINKSAQEVLSTLYQEEVEVKIYNISMEDFIKYIDSNSGTDNRIGIRGFVINRLRELLIKN